MSSYKVTVEGRPVTVEIPEPLHFSQPLTTMAEVESAVAAVAAWSVLPQLRDQISAKRIVRDNDGRIMGMVEEPPATALEQAMSVGRAFAKEYVATIVDEGEGAP